MTQLAYLISSDYARTTGGWIYNERVLQELRRLEYSIERNGLAAGFPDPGAEAIVAAGRVLAGLADGTLVLADQVVLSPLAGLLPEAAKRLRFAMLMHHPQVLEGSRPPALAARLDAEERGALQQMTLVIATSHLTAAQLVADYGVDAAKLITAEPGTDPQTPSPGSGGPGLHMLSTGSVIPRKRHELIIAALAGLQEHSWRLTIVGNLDREQGHVAMLRRMIEDHDLSQRIAFAGERTGKDMDALWKGADLYAAAAIHEGFGMAVAEAIARQIPVVSTRSGAVGSWLDPRASILVEPDDVATMRDALRRVLSEPQLRRDLRQGTGLARTALPTWQQTAAKIDAALRPMA